MTYIRPFTYSFNLTKDKTYVESFNFFTERDINLEEIDSILDFLGRYSNQLRNEKKFFMQKINMLLEDIIDLLHLYPSTCSDLLAGNYYCDQQHEFKSVLPNVFDDNEFVKYNRKDMYCHATLYKKKIFLEKILQYNFYEKIDDYLFSLSNLLQRCLGYFVMLEKIDVRFQKNKPYETHDLLNDIAKKMNVLKSFFSDIDPIKEIHLKSLKKYIEESIINEIENKNYINLLNDNILKIEKNLLKNFDFKNEIINC